jgi:succinate-acetate transporter protein
MARTIWTEAGPLLTSERIPLEWVEQAETSAAASVADPVPLGMAAFGLTIFLFGAIYAWFGTPSAHLRVLMPIAFWFGGIVEFLAAMWAMRKGSTFAATTMGVLSGFWLTWAGLSYVGMGGAGAAAVLGIYLALFGLITAYLFVAACRVNLALATVLGVTTLAFWAGAWGLGYSSLVAMRVAGWCAVAAGVIAFYASFAVVLGSTAQRELLPLGARCVSGLPDAGITSRPGVPLRSEYGAADRGRYQSATGLIGAKGGEVGPVESPAPDEL